jgi:hypothetical protein
MADDEALEIDEHSKKDREEAEQAKALNAVTDNVSSSRGNCSMLCRRASWWPSGTCWWT